MRIVSVLPMVFGVVILLFGLYLVSTGGSVGKTYIPSLIGLPNCKADPNSSQCATYSFAGYGPGTIVCLFGLGLLASSARSAMARAAQPPMPKIPFAPGAFPFMMPGSAPGAGPQPGVKYCPKCARGNATDAGFCQQCGGALPPGT